MENNQELHSVENIFNNDFIDIDTSCGISDASLECNTKAIEFANEGKFCEAIHEFDKAINQDPQVKELYHNRSICKFRSSLIDALFSIGTDVRGSSIEELRKLFEISKQIVNTLSVFFTD